MMQLSDGKIGTREFTSIVLFTVGIKFADTTADLLFHYAQNAAWMVPITSFILIVIPFLVMLSLLKKHKDQGLVDLLFGLAGKYGGFAIGFVLFLIMLAATAVNIRNYSDIVNTMYYQRTPVPFLLLLLLTACFFVANRGFETIGRIAWLVLPYIQIVVLLLVLFVRQESDYMHLFPIAGPGLKVVMSQSASHNAIFGEMILLTAFYPFVRAHKDFRFAALLGFGVSCFQLALFSALYVLIFDYPAVDQLVYPFHQLARAAAIGQSITNVEALFFGFWIISSAVHFSILLYLTVFLFGKTMRMNEFEPLLLPFAGLIFMLALIPDNVVVASSFRNWLLTISSVILPALPFLLWSLDRWKEARLSRETS